MSDDLSQSQCIPDRKVDSRLTDEEIVEFSSQIHDWSVIETDGVRKLCKVFRFKNFKEALAFTNKVGAIAEEQDHHPLMITEWGKVTVTWWTHSVKGLHKNDFIMAARTDALFKEIP